MNRPKWYMNNFMPRINGLKVESSYYTPLGKKTQNLLLFPLLFLIACIFLAHSILKSTMVTNTKTIT